MLATSNAGFFNELDVGSGVTKYLLDDGLAEGTAYGSSVTVPVLPCIAYKGGQKKGASWSLS